MFSDILSLVIGCFFVVSCFAIDIPPVKLEAFSPKGFRASIADAPGIQMFGFHGRKNKRLNNIEPGDFNKDVLQPTGGLWVYYEPSLQLDIGDVIYYWIFVQHNQLGYRQDNLEWNVTKFSELEPINCKISRTTINGGTQVCNEEVVFQSNFQDTDSLDLTKWVPEKYTPTYGQRGPNFEFVSYESDPSTTFIKNSILHLRPVPRDDVRGTLNLRNGCTSNDDAECYHVHQAAFILPPVKSAKIRSNFAFKYGKVDIGAKLPSGDWIFPMVSLSTKYNLNSTIWIAYARGNDHLTGKDNSDIGSRLLFAGPVVNPAEPERSIDLRSKSSTVPFTRDMHVYSVKWEPGTLTFSVDNEIYGTIPISNYRDFSEELHITLGVGVGGINDFPDGYISGATAKPWQNKYRNEVKDFYTAREIWKKTWKNNDCALQIDYVKVTAL